jgi:polar amino acid transport system substrate-binding protein
MIEHRGARYNSPCHPPAERTPAARLEVVKIIFEAAGGQHQISVSRVLAGHACLPDRPALRRRDRARGVELPPHHRTELPNMPHELAKTLAPTGVLRAGVNLANFLLVTGRAQNGDPQGVSPDIGAAIAERLGVPVEYVCYATPGEVADAAADESWDIAMIGAEPARAEKIAFTAAYAEIECTYLAPAGSPIRSIEEVDRAGIRIAVSARSAYDLWLERNIEHAELVRAPGLDASFDLFVEQQLDVLAGLRPRLLTEVEKLPGARVLDGKFSAVQQAVGTPRSRGEAAAAFLAKVV